MYTYHHNQIKLTMQLLSTFGHNVCLPQLVQPLQEVQIYLINPAYPLVTESTSHKKTTCTFNKGHIF